MRVQLTRKFSPLLLIIPMRIHGDQDVAAYSSEEHQDVSYCRTTPECAKRRSDRREHARHDGVMACAATQRANTAFQQAAVMASGGTGTQPGGARGKENDRQRTTVDVEDEPGKRTADPGSSRGSHVATWDARTVRTIHGSSTAQGHNVAPHQSLHHMSARRITCNSGIDSQIASANSRHASHILIKPLMCVRRCC